MGKKDNHSAQKYKWPIVISTVLLIIAYPFISLLINKITGISWGELYTFGLSLKEFMTPWIAFWGIIGIALGVVQMQIRISNQEKQHEMQKKQFEAQIENQQKQLNDIRFSSGVELLGNPNESARIGAAYNLYFRASEFPKEYLNTVCEILCAHVRTLTGNKEYQETYKEKPSNEIQTIIDLLFRKKNSTGDFIFDKCPKNLMGVFLHGANFFRATLNIVNLESAKLNEANFQSAALCEVIFSRATLSKVNFDSVKLSVINFKSAKLSKVNFGCIINVATLSDVDFLDAALSDVDFQSAKLSEVNFQSAKLSEVSFQSAKLSEVNFQSAKLNIVNFQSAKLNDVNFSGHDFNRSNLSSPKIKNVGLWSTTLSGVALWSATLNDVDFESAKIANVNFEKTVLDGCSYEEITHKGHSLELTKAKSQ